jgi:peroxiredoxin
MLKKIILPIFLGLLLLALGYALTHRHHAPGLQFTTLDGQSLKLEQLRGKFVAINFWATTCPGCVIEMPKLAETYQQYHARGFEVIAVAMPYDPPEQVGLFAKAHHLPFPVVPDTQGNISQAFSDVRLTPTTILIDKEGNIAGTVVGELNFTSLHQLLDRELGRAG